MADAETPTHGLAEMFAAKLTPHTCQACNGIGWTVDENWSPEGWQMRSGYERTEGEGLIPCGACSLGDWSTWRDERTEPTTVIDGLTWDEQIEVGDLLRAAAVRLRRLDRIEAALGDVDLSHGFFLSRHADACSYCSNGLVDCETADLIERIADAECDLYLNWAEMLTEEGCRCPVLDNAHGRGAWGTSGDDAVFWTSETCPLHGWTDA